MLAPQTSLIIQTTLETFMHRSDLCGCFHKYDDTTCAACRLLISLSLFVCRRALYRCVALGHGSSMLSFLEVKSCPNLSDCPIFFLGGGNPFQEAYTRKETRSKCPSRPDVPQRAVPPASRRDVNSCLCRLAFGGWSFRHDSWCCGPWEL